MLYETDTSHNCEKVIEKAEDFFKGDWGLEISSKKDCCALFQGGGGHVFLQCFEKNGAMKVELATREWDRQVKKFMRKV